VSSTYFAMIVWSPNLRDRRFITKCECYAGLYYTYPKDREKAAEAAQLMIHNADAQHFDASPIGEESRGLLNTVDSTGRIESELELAPLRQEAFLSHNRRNHQF
jgi:hypothetical protein